ncbi:inositol monophosphatase family protein [Streptomyces monomycini]|uniref:inositol monophosphatase family protein n=1 Tax=Streptomyces monomycini TaxID=371720 RepID=UPI0007C45964|nr:inositol monophosphatase family protein [Streptomyces monomycini]
MTYASLLAPMAAAAHEVGALLLTTPHRAAAPADSMEELAAAYLALEAPAVGLMRRHLDALLPGVPWAEELHDDRSPSAAPASELPAEGDVWMVDVIDGAVQLMQDLPYFCVSLALVRDGEPVAAALHAPLLGETYLAAAGHGATRNGERITPSTRTRLEAALVGTSHPPFAAGQLAAVAAAGRSLTAVLPAVGAVRNLGPTSWQIADTAAGRLDAFWEYGRDDANLLPGALVAREAGAVVSDTTGRPWQAGAPGFLVAPRGLHGELLVLLNRSAASVPSPALPGLSASADSPVPPAPLRS